MARALPIFFYGLFAACFALIFEGLFFGIFPLHFFGFLSGATSPLNLSLIVGFFLFAFLEEGARLLFLWRFRKSVSLEALNYQSALLLGGIFGLGFASLEILLGYFLNPLSGSSAIHFAFGALALHVLLSAGLASSVLRRSLSPPSIVLLLAAALILHLLYNLVIFLSAS